MTLGVTKSHDVPARTPGIDALVSFFCFAASGNRHIS